MIETRKHEFKIVHNRDVTAMQSQVANAGGWQVMSDRGGRYWGANYDTLDDAFAFIEAHATVERVKHESNRKSPGKIRKIDS